MKHDLKLLLAAAIALGLPVAARAATTLTQAQITQIIKDVKTIDPGKGERTAIMKETLQGEQALRTGIDSRAELLFNDHTITRLGANTHFSFTEGTRNMSLQSGVMLLQVPKGIGGAKIETAAVTAAVTGTTIMVEAGKDYTKLIVLEGECCLWPKDDKAGKNKLFKFKHKTCATEGQEIILRNGSKVIPDPVYVNLKILEGTSLLLTGPWNSPLNTTPINNAANGQGPGTYVPTNLAIIGAGTDVTVIQGLQPPPTPPPGSPGTPGATPPGKYGPLTTIPGSGGFTIGGGSTLNTDPKIINSGVTSYGRIYRGTILDGPPVPYLFGPGTNVSFPNDLEVDSDFPNYGVAAFKFASLNITGVPTFQMSGNGATQLALVSEGDINVTNANPTTLDFTPIVELDLLTAGGNINIDSNITITGLTKLELYSYGTANNITIDGNVELGSGYFSAGIEPGIQGNLIQSDAISVNSAEDDGDEADTSFKARTQGIYTQNGDIDANNVDVKAGTYIENGDIGDNSYVEGVTVKSQGALTENGQIFADSIDLEAQGAFGGTGALNGYYITIAGGGVVTLNETYPDDAQTDTVNGVTINVNYPLFSLSLTGNEVDIPTGFNGTPEYYEGPTVDLTLTSNAGDDLPGNITMSGNISVDNLEATAANNITADDTTNIYSNSDFQLNAGGNVEIDGTVQANSIELTGGTNATISGSADVTSYNSVAIMATSGSVTINGTVDAQNSITGTSGGDFTTGSYASLTAEGDVPGSITITSTGASNTVTLDGTFNAGTIAITGYNVHTMATEEGAGLYASTSINIYATNNVTLDGYIQTPSLTVTGINNGPVPANVTIPGTSQIYSDIIQINAGIVDVEGFVTGDLNGSGEDEDGVGSSLFSVTTTASDAPLLFMGSPDGDTYQDFYSTTGGYIDAQTIQVTSRGDLFLDSMSIPGEDGDVISPTLNGAVIDPYGDLNELDLSGATIEVDAGYSYGSILNLTSTNGDITIKADINLGTGDGSEFSANSASNIVFTGEQTVTADTVSLTANQITTPVDPTISSGNITVGVNGANVTLSQDEDTASTFYLNEYDPVTTDPVGSLTLDLSSSSDPVLSVSGNSLIVGDLNGSSFDSFTLSLTSLNDINAGDNSATITAATSLTLQVGVTADLAGGGSSNISYNGGQLTIDDSVLGSFSVTATSVEVDEGFPSIANTSLSLTATGEDEDTGSIFVNTDLNIASGNFTSDNGDISTDAITTSDGGSLTLTANNGIITVNGALTTGSGGGITLSAESITAYDPVTTGSGGSISLTASNGDLLAFGALTTTGTGGGITLAATNGGISTEDTITTGSGGNLTITTSGTSPTGDINVNGGLSIGGTFTASASGSIFIELADPTIGSDMSLTAAGAIEVDENITIDGNLTLSAGTYIHTQNGATIYGATSVTLTLGAPADISETIGDSSTLYFGAVAEEEDHQPLAIDLTDVISNDSYINATATSLTLTNTFDEPNIDLTLTASSGTLTVSGSGSVTADSFTGNSQNGDIVISEPLNLNNDFTATGTNGNIVINSAISASSFSATTVDGGNITINAAQDIPQFYADAENGNLVINEPVTATQYFEAYANSITGTGSITSPSVSLTQSGTATVGQIGANQLSYNTLTSVTVSPTEGDSSLYLSASPLLLTSNLTLTNVSLTLGFGSVNTQGNTITADNITAEYLSTTTGASGNSTNLTLNGNTSVTLEELNMNGANGTAGSGGTLIATGSGNEGSYVAIYYNVNSNGGSSGGNGGTINLTAEDNINTIDATVSANGGSGGGNGGTVSLTAQAGTIASLAITANGGDANPTGATAGGNGGTINLTSASDLDIEGTITANGGAANPNSAAAGGNGGTVNITSGGAIDVENSIVATSGVNGNSKFTGGNGGTVNLTAQGEITVDSGIEVSSSDLYANRVSAKGGNINVTSHAATGVAINITNSGQLAALLNQGTPGPGGAITFIADTGGNINVSGSVRADAGTIKIQTGTVDGSGAGGAVALNGATLSADVVKVGSLGANGSLTIGNSTINGDTAIALYAAGDNGSVIFSGNTSLSGAGIKTIAGSTVTIVNGVLVNISGGAATVYTNTPNYNKANYGSFTGVPVTTKPFASRPGF